MKIIGKLSATNHHFKYIVNCIILAAGSNGMDVAGLCFWDQEMDGSVTIKWDNKNLTCIVNIFGCAVWFKYSQYTSFLIAILGNYIPFLIIFYFYVIRINLTHLSLNIVFLSCLRSGKSMSELEFFDEFSFSVFLGMAKVPICSISLWLKYEDIELFLGWYFRS